MLYYFHLLDGADILLDPEGLDLEGIKAVERIALKEARTLISHEALSGAIDMDQRIEVRDPSGAVVHLLEFADAVSVSKGRPLTSA